LETVAVKGAALKTASVLPTPFVDVGVGVGVDVVLDVAVNLDGDGDVNEDIQL
jgi:hypothetical protein